MAKEMTRITWYQDPFNSREWVVAGDCGDPSEETVIDCYEDEGEAENAARAEADRRGIEAEYLPCDIL